MQPREIKCRYCSFAFYPQPQVRGKGKHKRTYLECPRCGNGFEREYRWYDNRKRVAANG